MFKNIYKSKKILLTGHTGFKGSWMTKWLLHLGAEVVGISNKRMAGQELILRFMAFQILEDTQFKNMGNFLDLAMVELDQKNLEELGYLNDQ